MSQHTRRDFIRNSAAILALSIPAFDSTSKTRVPPLSFSTLGCPDWSLEQIVQFASDHKYSGVEIRGIQRVLNLPKSPYFSSASAINETKRKLKNKRLSIIGLGSSAAMHHAGKSEREKAMTEAKSFIDLAYELDCPYVRVFPDKLLKDQEKQKSLDLIIGGLDQLGSYAGKAGVQVLMETHGDLVHADDLQLVMNSLSADNNTGLVWDIGNMWMVTRETPAMVHQKIKKWIRHIHLKDLNMVQGKAQYTLMGNGEVPIFEAIDVLVKDGYKGYLSFEWEKLWHPEIEAPEIAIAQFSERVRSHFK